MNSSWCLSSSTFASPYLLPAKQSSPSLHVNSKCKVLSFHKDKQSTPSLSAEPQISSLNKLTSLLQYAAVLASVEAPSAMAVTGNNNEDDLITTLISAGVIALLYLFVAPPIILNWMRLRWYKRKFLEMYLQFMCAFIFFPGLMLWAPFVNFRKFPRDPTMKYPWSTPKDDVPLYKSR
ncbi:NAD(P)H-quinone oxidoreductase subunit L, chloroplastic isoform X1 [Typha angustifolia]|uniref:NAD(P)H-quinone oxidoreductase subunit L, chloroplastic isoform X1 n=1 Tax=Typha angustifolia TaxID=59011 RepID=UPI003C2C6538